MDSPESDCLFSAIGAFLHECRNEAEMQSCRAFWHGRPWITAAEIDVLVALGDGSLCAEALALELGRDLGSTRELLGALVSVGILERRGERYVATPAAILYCRSVAQGRLSPGENRDA